MTAPARALGSPWGFTITERRLRRSMKALRHVDWNAYLACKVFGEGGTPDPAALSRGLNFLREDMRP
jgi:hypothetical protein